ncbi:hypothetical protein BDN72DRAFT_689352 [Pluteus cervinus]|uniref:Uncharacterized protein n=1 Tax=Pluteus cervinus TaxID=181527 RepID=A0ACD3AR41_9AGAR|nr:hypothetical protein BDN72DRAFT_689352 [Pluteus cervinus]
MEEDSWDEESVIRTPSIHEVSFIKKVVPCEPERVFSATRLIRYNQKLRAERLHFPSLLQMLQLQEYKLTIQLANHKALSLRERYDSPGYLDAWERPFRWTDPAEPLLDYNEDIEGTLVVVSDRPCSIPHIIISSPEPQDPSIGYDNATNDPQDYGFGKWLTVPSFLTTFINVHPGQPEPWYSSQPHSISQTCEENDDSKYSGTDDCATVYDATLDEIAEEYPDIQSRAETPAPLTPEMPDRGLSGCPLRTTGDDDEDTDIFIYHGISTPPEDVDVKDGAILVTSTSPRQFTKANRSTRLFGDMGAQMRTDDDGFEVALASIPRVLENFDSDETDTEEDESEREEEQEELQKESQWHIDEDEEDLPPLDDWYQSVANRTNMKIPGLV